MDEILYVVVAIAVLIFIIPYALAVLLYAFPVFLLWLLFPNRVGPEPELIVDALSFSSFAKLRAEKRMTEDAYNEVRHSDTNIRWSYNLDRFEERSMRGRELNEKLEYWQSESQRVVSEIEKLEKPQEKAVMAWRKALFARSRKQAKNAAKRSGSKGAILSFGIVWIAAEIIGEAFPGFVAYFKFAWNPDAEHLHPGIAVGAAAGWAAGIYRLCHPSKIFDGLVRAKIQEFEDAKEARKQAEDEAIEQARRAGRTNDFEEDEECEDEAEDPVEPWYEALGVSSDATKAEITMAYRAKIKQYHPDRVSGLGEKLRALAETETQKLNAAKDEGLAQLG